jgi:hypothetical protein
MRFLVAPRLGLGLAVPERGQLALLDVNDPVVREPRSFEVRRLLDSHHHEIDEIDHHSARATITRDSVIAKALDCFASGLDKTLPERVRLVAIQALHSLISSDESLLPELERVVWSVPLDAESDAECDVAWRLAVMSNAREASALYRSLRMNLPIMRSVYASLLESLQNDAFGLLRDLLVATVVESRLVGDMISRRTAVTTLEQIRELLQTAFRNLRFEWGADAVTGDAVEAMLPVFVRFMKERDQRAQIPQIVSDARAPRRRTPRYVPSPYSPGLGGAPGLAVDYAIHDRFPQYEVNAYLEFTGAEVALHHRIQNISLGGVCLEVSRVEDVGTTVDLVINFPDLSASLSVRGQVVWVNRNPPMDMGIRYIELDNERREMLRKYIRMVRHS